MSAFGTKQTFKTPYAPLVFFQRIRYIHIMDIEILSAVCMTLILLGVLVSAYFWIFVPLVFLFVSAILECEYGEITDWVYISLIFVSLIAMIVRTFRKSNVRYAAS